MSVRLRGAAAHRVAVAVALTLAGCANPIVRLEIPGHGVEKSPAPTREPESMAEAVQKLNYVRAVYYESIRMQTGLAQDSVTGLVWLGAAMAGMAAGRVHRDAIVTTALIGGTTYGLTTAQLDKRRIEVWQAGIEALDCARKAALPLEIAEERRVALQNALSRMESQRQATTLAREAVVRLLDSPALTPSQKQPMQGLVQAAEATLRSVGPTARAASDFLMATRGAELSATVNRVSGRVTEVMGNVALAPSAVKDVLGALFTNVEIFAPGLKLGDAAKAGFEKALPALGAQSGGSAEAVRATEALKVAVAALLEAQAETAGLIRSVNVKAVSTALDACQVAAVITPLLLVPATLDFTSGVARAAGFQIKGALPPYRVKPLAPLPEGLKSEFEGGDSTTVAVSATDKAPAGEYRLLITDRSNPPQSEQLVIHVVPAAAGASVGTSAATRTAAVKAPPPAASKPPPPTVAASGAQSGAGLTATTGPVAGTTAVTPVAPPPTDATLDTEKAWRTFQGALTAPTFSRTLRGVTFSVQSAEFKSARLFIKLKCSKPDAGLQVAEVRDELVRADPAAIDVLKRGSAINAQLTQLDLSRSVPCVKE